MKRSAIYSSTILNLSATWRCLISLTGRRLTSRETCPSTHCVEDCVGLRACVDVMLPLLGIEPQLLGRPAHSLVAAPTELS
jgi:hypothetical protein